MAFRRGPGLLPAVVILVGDMIQVKKPFAPYGRLRAFFIGTSFENAVFE